VLQPRNRPLLRALGVVIWLTASEEVIWERVSRNQNRPLLQTDDPRTTLSNLLSKRSPLYGSVADITVETSGLTHQQVADRAVEAIRAWSTARNEDHN
jgi:shikimate kinase